MISSWHVWRVENEHVNESCQSLAERIQQMAQNRVKAHLGVLVSV